MNKQVLQLHFKGSDNKQHTIVITNPKADLPEATIKQVMEKIIQTGLFVKDDNALYETVVGAAYVSTTTNAVFKA